MPLRVVLGISRQALRACGADPWVAAVQYALDYVKQARLTLVTSIGQQTWEMVAALAADRDIPLLVIIPASRSQTESEADRLARQFGLVKGRDTIEMIDTPAGASKVDALALRDRRCFERADLVIPISIRSGGHMDRLVNEAESAGKTLDRRWQIPHRASRTRIGYRVDSERLDHSIDLIAERYLIHWTRAAGGHWPTETAGEYYVACAGSSSYPRTALDTLVNIIRKQRLVASSRHMPGGIATVAFSSQPIVEMVSLMRWRARYREMSFEPFGIGIERACAASLGIRPVSYRGSATLCPADEPHWLTQSIGRRSDWRVECEWRCRGDLDLRPIDTSKLALFVCTPADAELVRQSTSLAVYSFGGPDSAT